MLIEIVGDVVTQPFGPLAKAIGERRISLKHHDIDQHMQVLMSDTEPDVLISHAMLSFFFDGNWAAAIENMKSYCAAVVAFAARAKTLTILNSILPPARSLVGFSELEQYELVSRLNGMLMECARVEPMVAVADLASVIHETGTAQAINLQNQFVMKMPYTRKVLPALIEEYAKRVRERFVPRKKVLLLDADNTLWGGVIGEDGVNGVVADLEYPGVVFRKFQEQLIAASASGIILALVTKNNEDDVREAFSSLSMPLKWDSFSAIRANWEPKSENILAIAEELNVGLDSMVFIDDNPFEIEQVSQALPDIDCYQFDGSRADSALSLLNTIKDLHTWSLTDEDLAKSDQYRQEAQRKNVKTKSSTIDEYIASLEISIEVGRNRIEQHKRIAQLTNKTNQFNLTTKRYSEKEIIEAMESGDVFDFRVKDRFGDMGVVGVVIVRDSKIETFLMSCRALGRQIEGEILRYVVAHSGASGLAAAYKKTAKNGMVSDFYERNGFELVGEDQGTKRYRSMGRIARGGISSIVEVE